MKCPRCQKESLIGAEYCVRCGAHLLSGAQARGLPSSDADGLPEIKRHVSEIAVRLSKVEGRVTLISERMGLDPVKPEPAVSRPEEAPRAEFEREIVGESFPVEVLAAEGVATGLPCEPTPVTCEASPAALLMPSAAAVEPHVGEQDEAVVPEPPSPSEPGLAEAVAADHRPAEIIKPGPERDESAEAEWVAPEIPTPPPTDMKAETPSAGQTVPAKPVVADSKAAEFVRTKSGSEKTAANAQVPSARPPQKPPKPHQPSQSARRMREWEQALPGNWLSRIGIVALFIGLGFLAKLAYDRDWIGPVTQLLAGLGCGGALLLAGHHWRKMYRAWAQALTGGGIGVLYLSVFGSYGLHHLMPFWATFLLMFVVTVLAVGTALRRDSMSIAIIGLVGAFLVPITLGAIDQSAGHNGGGNNTGLLIAYVLTLDAAVVWLASLRNWRWFTLLGFVGSMAIFSLWYCTGEKDGLVGPAHGMLTGIFLCFAAATTLFHGLQRHRPQLTDLALMTLNAAVYFGVSHYLLWEDYRGWAGSLGFGLAALYAVLGYLFLQKSEDNRLLSAFAFGIAITFLTVAIPVQLDKSYMTAAWAAEGAVLTWLAVRYGTPRWQLWGLGAFALVVVRLFAFDQFVGRVDFHPVMNNMFWAFAPSVVAFYAAAYFLRQKERALQSWFFPMMMLLASFLTIWLFSFEIIHFAGSRITAAHVNGTVGYDFRSVENARNLSLVALWGVYGLALVYAGARKDWVWLRLGGYALVAVAVGTTLVELNYLHAMIRSGVSNPIANYSFGALAVCVSVLGLVAHLVRKYGDKMTEAEKAGFPVVASMANILAVYALSAEVFTFLDKPLNARNLVLVALWAAYGLGIMIVGLWRGWTWLRAQGWILALMAIGMTLTTLNYGHFLMDKAPVYPIGNYSFGAFAIGVGVVSAFAYLVAAYGKRLHSAETSAFPILVSMGSILAIYALSAEVSTFLDEPLNGRNLVLVALWAAYGLGIMIVGLWRGWTWLRAQGWVLALMAIGMTMTTLNYGHFLMKEGPVYAIGNYSFGAFAICIGMVSALACLVASNRKRFHATENGVFPGLVLLANFLALWAFSCEAITFIRGPENARNLVLVVIWCAYGLGLLMIGIRKNWDWLRVAGYVLAVVATGATLTLLNHSHARIDSVHHSIPILNYSLGGFAICVAALYLYAYVVARNKEQVHDFEKVVCIVALAAANVLTLWGLSEEIVAFLDGNLQNLMLVLLWTGYGSLLMALGVARKALLSRLGACALMVMAVGATGILLNHWHAGIQPWPILNYSFGGFAVCIIALYLYAYLTARPSDEAGRFDQVVCGVALAVANVLTIWALSAEVITFLTDSGNVRNLALVIVWSGYGLLLMLAGAWKGIPVARFAGYALVVAAIGMTTTMLNHAQPGLQRSNYYVLINPSFGGFLVCVIALYLASFVIARNSSKIIDAEKVVLAVLIVAANVLSIFALSSEILTYAPAGNGQSMGLTVLWATYGLAVMVVGVMGRWPRVRLGGLALVSVAVLKLFILDTLRLDAGYRVGAYISVGVILLAGGFVYHRYADVIKGFIMDRPEKGADSAQR